MATKIFIIRHGETAWNRNNVFRGTCDIPLNENGKKQSKLVAQSLEAVKIEAVYMSPLSRARETAEIVSRPHGISPKVHDGFHKNAIFAHPHSRT